MANYSNHKRSYYCEACKSKVGHFHALTCKMSEVFYAKFKRAPKITKIR